MRNYRPGDLSIEIHGTKGTISVNEDKLVLFLDEDGLLRAGRHFFHVSELTPKIPYLLSYPENSLEDMHFFQSLLDKKQPETNFREAAKANVLADKIRGFSP
jgi:hypothetical protein